jgi:hypothetical protein
MKNESERTYFRDLSGAMKLATIGGWIAFGWTVIIAAIMGIAFAIELIATIAGA